ncbi:aminoglycoside phosphotransferase family protein [Streptomyces sp. NBC_00588]|jgi:aminoglycoside phosphotransferase (APT) family kinase protein|uniref:aminoglycoside phosphotransferase family protein n=1 Tax=Streptomyces sp. NBC_00588 TaxID=2975784 RepID=UPI002E80B533|nr:aminoglycoside phosphotransferase family protein [Streptomyces sp. NBC_00588]WUB36818.1 aminoglycoside phosphotransferase family protein [Streptomyces sp. NBC_00588]
MTPQLVSGTRQRAEQVSRDASVLKGPLKGYHHETYVLALPDGSRTVKFREPRAEILWYDRRCFRSEEQLLRALKGHVTRIPDILDVAGMSMQGFIEGRTLRSRRWAGRRVTDAVFDQILDLFREMVRITPDMLSVERRCEEKDRPDDGDTDGFLERLIVFIEDNVYTKNSARFAGLFGELGIEYRESFARLRKSVSGLRRRPFCLLHADLHRKNMVVDSQGLLWAIDWELAMLGDPLYDLATHLYLMRYPEDQKNRMTQEWCRVVEGIRSGSSYGWENDLPLILDFKRAQSVFTDVIRIALSLHEETIFNRVRRLPWEAWRLQKILENAAEPLGLDRTRSHSEITSALTRWLRTQDQPMAERVSSAPEPDRF